MHRFVDSMIKIVYDIQVYRENLEHIIEKSDVVVELGCHVGNSTRIIADKASNGQIIAIDNSPEAVSSMESVMNDYPHVKFTKADARLHETLETVYNKIKKCDVLSVDLGGGYHPDTTFKVYFIWSSTLKPKKTIIRNRGLLDFVLSSQTEECIKSNEGWLESSNDAGIPPRLKELKLWSNKL
jgi:23S rRNA U2552 (ribose-2'-O)-methylase RlmE/FtsJ